MQFHLEAYQRRSRRFLNCLLNCLQMVGKCIRHQVRSSTVLADARFHSHSTFRMPLLRRRSLVRRLLIQVDLAAVARLNPASRPVRPTTRQFGLSIDHDISLRIVGHSMVPADDFKSDL